MTQVKKLFITLTGSLLLVVGILFIILPGPAILFIPLGLALLSIEYQAAKNWLKRYQRYASRGAQQMDQKVSQLRYRFRNR